MRWNLIWKLAWHDLAKGRGRFIWLLVTVLLGCLLRLSRFEQMVFSDSMKALKMNDTRYFTMAWNEYPFSAICLLILALTQIYNYQNKVVQREILAGLTRAEFFLRQYAYIILLVVSQIVFFLIFYFLTDLIIKVAQDNFSYSFENNIISYYIFEEIVKDIFYASIAILFINYFRSYMLLLGYIALAIVESIVFMKLEYEPEWQIYISFLPFKSISLAFSPSFTQFNIIAAACIWVCIGILFNAWLWAKRAVK